MFARTLLGVTAALVAGCATVPKPFVGGEPSSPTPTCKSAADCDAKWSAARTYLITHTSYSLQYDSVDRLETFNPANDVTMGLRSKVNKEIQPDGSYAIVAKFWCNNLFECRPNADKTLDDFNRTVGTAGSGSASLAAKPPVAASPPPAAVPLGENGAGADSQTTPVEAEKYIRDSEAAWAESVSSSDASVIKRILADDVVWVLDGRTLDKSAAILAAANGASDFVSNHLDYATVRLFGDTAIAQGSDTWTRTGGKSGHFIWTDTWIRRNGQWQIVAAHQSVTSLSAAGGTGR